MKPLNASNVSDISGDHVSFDASNVSDISGDHVSFFEEREGHSNGPDNAYGNHMQFTVEGLKTNGLEWVPMKQGGFSAWVQQSADYSSKEVIIAPESIVPVHRNVVGDTTIYFIYGLPMTVIEFADDSIKTTILGREPSKGQVSAHVIKKNTYFSRFIASEGEPGTLMFTYAGFINVPGGNQKTERATKEGLRKEYPRTPEWVLEKLVATEAKGM